MEEVLRTQKLVGTTSDHSPISKVVLFENLSSIKPTDRSSRSGLRMAKAVVQLQSNIQKVQQSERDIVNILLEYGNNPKGWPAIIYATHVEDEYAIKALVEYGVDINIWFQGPRGEEIGPPLMMTLLKNNLELARYFLEHGASKTAFREKNLTAALQSLEATKLLYDYGITLPRVNTITYYDCVEWIAHAASIEVIRFYISKGVDFNVSPPNGNPSNILFCTVSRGNLEILKLILDHLRVQRSDLGKALHYPIYTNNLELTKFLFQKGAILAPIEKNLDYLFRDRRLEMISYLAEKGLNLERIMIYNGNGRLIKAQYFTPLQIAVYEKDYEYAEFLLKLGASATNKGSLKNTPLQMAIESNDRDMIELLVRYTSEIGDV